MPDEGETSRGRPTDPDSLRSRLERGEAKAMQVILAAELYRGLKVQAALTDRSLSELVGEAVTEWLAKQGE